MAVSTLSNMINPEVMGDMLEAKLNKALKLTPYAKVDNTLVGVPGDTKTVPSWNYVGDAADVAEGVECDLSTMTASSATFTIKKAMKSIGLTQEAILSGNGNPAGQAVSQLSKAIASKIDQDVMDAALQATVVVDKTAADIDYNAIVDCVTKFEDEEDGIDKVMFIHPKQEGTLLKDSSFISADKFQAGVAVNGAIGKIAGCWIKKSLRVPRIESASAVTGVYTLTIAGTATVGDVVKINGITVYTAAAADAASAVVTAIKSAVDGNATLSALYSTSKNSGVLTLTEKSGKEGAGAPESSVSENASITATDATTTAGRAAVTGHYECPIIKLQPDDASTEYTEDELPAITIFVKKDVSLDDEFIPRKQQHEFTAAKYYGVALTNAAKVVVGKFGLEA